MHSKIFQLSQTTIPEEEYISDMDFVDHWFTYSIADYTSNSDRAEDIKWLKDVYDGKGISFGTDDGGEYIIIVDKALYFQNGFSAFQNMLKVLQNASLEEFASSRTSMAMHQLNEAYDDKYDFYVDFDGYVQTLDRFIRENSDGGKYYIGATLDYHY